MRCLDCNNLTSHSQKMKAEGFGNCKARTEWKYLSVTYDRNCEKFDQVPAGVNRDGWAVKVGAA